MQQHRFFYAAGPARCACAPAARCPAHPLGPATQPLLGLVAPAGHPARGGVAPRVLAPHRRAGKAAAAFALKPRCIEAVEEVLRSRGLAAAACLRARLDMARMHLPCSGRACRPWRVPPHPLPPPPGLRTQGRPPGVLGLWPSRAVTFLENHDTGEPASLLLTVVFLLLLPLRMLACLFGCKSSQLEEGEEGPQQGASTARHPAPHPNAPPTRHPPPPAGSTLNHWPFPWKHLPEAYCYLLTHCGT